MQLSDTSQMAIQFNTTAREKLEIDPGNPRYLKVVWGKGYKLNGGKNEG